MFGWFKSKEQRVREAELVADLAMMDRATAFALQEVGALQTRYPEPLQRQAADMIPRLLIATERSAAGVVSLDAITEKFQSADRVHLATASSLTKRLVLAGALAEKLEPSDWLAFASSFASLEGVVAGFIQRAGGQVWPVRYYDAIDFERFRVQALTSFAATKAESKGELHLANQEPLRS